MFHQAQKSGEGVQHAKKLEKVDIAQDQEERPLCHEETFNTPPTSPNAEVATPQVRRSLRKHTLPLMSTPSRWHIRPQKKQVWSRECGIEAKQVEEDVAKGKAQEAYEDLAKQEEVANIQASKLYLEVELPDGRLARQCLASEDCPKHFAYIFKRLRMMSHLKTCHGIIVKIEKRPGGRPLHKEAERRENLLPNSEVKAWHNAAIKRFADKDRKFRQNYKRYQYIMRMRAYQSWKDLGKQYKHMEHWTCYVMYLATHAKIAGLRERKNHLLYYNPLGCTTMMDIVPILHSAMQAMAQGVKAHDVQHALLEPATKFELKVLKGPIQPNGIDCGFYVMVVIRYIIRSCLQEKSKSWDPYSVHQKESDNPPVKRRTRSTHLTNLSKNYLPIVLGAQEGILKDFPEDQESRNPESQERKTTRRCSPSNQEREGEEGIPWYKEAIQGSILGDQEEVEEERNSGSQERTAIQEGKGEKGTPEFQGQGAKQGNIPDNQENVEKAGNPETQERRTQIFFPDF
ncbi:hypothetical protein L7F22_046986 [Adiantum nelumboides]|nr:hypothetical protein [Adiantum nelumboides]